MSDAQEMQEAYDSSQGTQVLNPTGPGAPVRYPLVGTTLTSPIFCWIVYNDGSADIWVAFDQNANAVTGVGYKVPPKAAYRLPITTRSYISVDGGDGSDVDCSPFKFEQ